VTLSRIRKNKFFTKTFAFAWI